MLPFFLVQQQTAAIIHRFGKHTRIAQPGLNILIPLIEHVAGRVNLRVRQLDVNVETKTQDNVFVKVIVSVQFYVLPNKIYDAFYKLDDPERQIRSYIFDVVRARVPKIKLDHVFEKKDEIATVVKNELAQVMDDFGYGILKTLVTDIDPDPKVKTAMNEINAAQRLRIAATEKGEAQKILQVKSAEAQAQAQALTGKGIADQRQAIIQGLQQSVHQFQQTLPHTTANQILNLVLITQYFDTLKEITNTTKTNTILIPHTPNHLTNLADQIRNALITGTHTANLNNPNQTDPPNPNPNPDPQPNQTNQTQTNQPNPNPNQP